MRQFWRFDGRLDVCSGDSGAMWHGWSRVKVPARERVSVIAVGRSLEVVLDR